MRLCSPAGMAAMHVFFPIGAAKWRRCFVSLCSPQQNGGNVVFFPIGAEMAEVHVYLSLFHSVCGGRGRPLQTQLRCGH